MSVDFFANGKAHGSVASRLLKAKMDLNALRPFIGKDGNAYVNQRIKKGPHKGQMRAVRVNAEALILREEWKEIDDTVTRVAPDELKLVGDLRRRGLTRTLSRGMGKTTYEYTVAGGINGAILSMDPIRQSERDRPSYDTRGIPLPVIHKDANFTLRDLEVARNGEDLDTYMIEESTVKVAELAEDLLSGSYGSYTYAGKTLYGYMNFPQRNTKVLTSPDDLAWVPKTTNDEVRAMKQQSLDDKHKGPWVLYVSPAWDFYLDDDYSEVKGNATLRQRLLDITGIQEVTTVDRLPGFTMLLVEMSSRTVREIIGFDIRTIFWEEKGGYELFFKVVAMLVPLLMTDIEGNSGIVHGAPV